ncbi:MAG TPA: polyprenyl diphosphate synthase [Candidatus Saccharimonadales bacterium]|nr:polyprenyl diphosphate synthase [Candidatus Saccharimonadales bacterium]
MNSSAIPQHVAIIPDGSRRWAKQHNLTANDGHKAGYDNLKQIADAAFARGISYVTGYVFSTENWSRADAEVGYLMKLAAYAIKEETKQFVAKGIRIRILGSRAGLDSKLARGLDQVEEQTKAGTAGTIGICFNYGGRRDVVEAVQQLVRAGVAAEDITEERLATGLTSAGLPDPDLIIRTSGEQRLSNYLIWESAYSELYFTDCLWPDFNEAELDTALAAYAQRKRNFGK